MGAVAVWVWKTDKGRRVRNRVALRLPLIKVIVLYSVVERVTRILGAMSRAGVPLPDAMAAAIQGANNSVFEEGLQGAQTRMLEGEGLAGPIDDTGLFPEAAIQMMRVGENTGTLDVQLENASDYYSKELEYKLKKLTTLLRARGHRCHGSRRRLRRRRARAGDVRHLLRTDARQPQVTRRGGGSPRHRTLTDDPALGLRRRDEIACMFFTNRRHSKCEVVYNSKTRI